MPANQLTALDATFLELEQDDDSALMHIGGALVFGPVDGGGTPTIDQVREHVAARLDRLPRYRQKLSTPRTVGFVWPSWERDPRFDLDGHIRHATLPTPGGEPELLDWISDFYSHRLDQGAVHCGRWRCSMAWPAAGRRWSGKPTTAWPTAWARSGPYTCCSTPTPTATCQRPTAPPRLPELMNTRDGSRVRPDWCAGRRAPVVWQRVRARTRCFTPKRRWSASRAIIDLLIRDELIAAPHSSLNAPIGATRRIATVHVERKPLEEIRSVLGGKLNDVVLYAATRGLRALLLARGEELPRQGLRAMVPVNIRQTKKDGELGNKVSSMFVELPVAEADPRRT